MTYKYDKAFYEYIEKGSKKSAEALVPVVLDFLEVKSVLDVGCGAGAWLAVWKQHDIAITGLDGDYVDRASLLIEESEFSPTDLKSSFELNQRYSLAQSLEVAEHLPEESSRGLVRSICRHSDHVLFSAACPGQGGENHINEKPYEYWMELFAEEGYFCLDAIRPKILNNPQVKPWYRYNTFFYVKDSAFESLPANIKKSRLVTRPSDISPIRYKIRKFFIRQLPPSLMTSIARIKEHLIIAKQRI